MATGETAPYGNIILKKGIIVEDQQPAKRDKKGNGGAGTTEDELEQDGEMEEDDNVAPSIRNKTRRGGNGATGQYDTLYD